MAQSFMDQYWNLHTTNDNRVKLVAEDGTEVLELSRPDRDSNLFAAGYIAGLHSKAVAERKEKKGIKRG